MTYTCTVCKGVCESERPDQDALDELRDHWGDVPAKDCALVCDDCWQRMGLPFMAYVTQIGQIAVTA